MHLLSDCCQFLDEWWMCSKNLLLITLVACSLLKKTPWTLTSYWSSRSETMKSVMHCSLRSFTTSSSVKTVEAATGRNLQNFLGSCGGKLGNTHFSGWWLLTGLFNWGLTKVYPGVKVYCFLFIAFLLSQPVVTRGCSLSLVLLEFSSS